MYPSIAIQHNRLKESSIRFQNIHPNVQVQTWNWDWRKTGLRPSHETIVALFKVVSRGLYSEGRFNGRFLCYEFEGLIFGGAYTWVGLIFGILR